MKRSFYIGSLLAGILLAFTSCQEPVGMELPVEQVQEGFVKVVFDAEVPGMSEVQTKVVDPDGEDISNMTLFCFDSRGLFLSTVTAKLNADKNVPSLSGTFEAVIPEITERIHFVANQNMGLFPESAFLAKTETEVLSIMEGSSGMMIYWSRFVKDNASSKSIKEQLLEKGISLVRNHAKISVANPDNEFVTITGFAAVNTNAFGTVAPYSDAYGWVAPTMAQPFVTIPHDDSKLSDITDVRTIVSEPEQYIFESPNTSGDPVSVILRGVSGGTAKYYRVMLMDQNGDFVPLMRNHSYIINIAGELSYGQDSFDAALTAPATNNVWLSISDMVNEVRDTRYILSVEKTHIVLSDYNAGAFSLYYNLEKVDGSAVTSSDQVPSVTWLDGNNVAQHTFTNLYRLPGDASYRGDGRKAEGEVIISLLELGDEVKREGTLLVKIGALQRKIKVTTVAVQSFEPAWVTTNIYGGAVNEHVTMMFTIPDNCPVELFPLEVLISVDALDVRSESGMALPIRRKGEDGYGADNGIGYKYVLTVNETGKQRVYMETILEQEGGSTLDISIEADHFTSLTKSTIFNSENVNKYILLHNLRTYSAEEPADEVIYFYLVPQKKNAVVAFDTHFGTNITWNSDHTVADFDPIQPTDKDEFLFYSKYLSHDESMSQDNLDFVFYPVDEDNWGSGGRVYGFKSKGKQSSDYGAVFHMVTNSSRSREVVRIASNPVGQPSVTGTGLCGGAQFRSAIFELSTFNAFHFGATIDGVGTMVSGTNEEVVDNVSLSYEPELEVDIEFDITSFKSSILTVSDQNEQLSVDPFGTAFEIYIDAPMLELDQARLAGSKAAGKVKADPNKEGRFIYIVDADREEEKKYGEKAAAIADDSKLDLFRNPLPAGFNQNGERKVIPFKKKDIVSAGNVTISSQDDIVVYYSKTFKLTNTSITGSIKYGDDSSSAVSVPVRSFVPMERVKDNTRIGSMTVTEDGKYELRLRAEYDFNWYQDEIKFEFNSNGVHYSATVNSLEDLFKSTDLVLTPSAGH